MSKPLDQTDVDQDQKACDQTELSRRDALIRLAKLSAYTAPAVTALLTPSMSYASGSGIPPGDVACNEDTGTHYGGVLGADNNASRVGGDASNENGYNDPQNGWVEPGDGWQSGGDQQAYNGSFNHDSEADCGK